MTRGKGMDLAAEGRPEAAQPEKHQWDPVGEECPLVGAVLQVKGGGIQDRTMMR